MRISAAVRPTLLGGIYNHVISVQARDGLGSSFMLSLGLGVFINVGVFVIYRSLVVLLVLHNVVWVIIFFRFRWGRAHDPVTLVYCMYVCMLVMSLFFLPAASLFILYCGVHFVNLWGSLGLKRRLCCQLLIIKMYVNCFTSSHSSHCGCHFG